MSAETRVLNQEGPAAGVPILALNARGEETLASMSSRRSSVNTWIYHVHLEDVDEDEWGVKPASQNAIENLERITIEGLMSVKVCSICLEEFSIGLEAIRMPMPCSHVYHPECIKTWLNKCNTCPLCRFEMPC